MEVRDIKIELRDNVFVAEASIFIDGKDTGKLVYLACQSYPTEEYILSCAKKWWVD